MQHLNNHQYTNSWHWTDKDISPQFKQKIMDNLDKINFKVDNSQVVEAVLHRRKGKLYLIFEVTLDGTSADGNSFSIYEWDHDTELNDMMKCNDSKDKQLIIDALTGIDDEMKKVHGKDLGVADNEAAPAPVKVTANAADNNKKSDNSGPSGSVCVKDSFYCANEQFAELFTKPEMIKIWSRNILQIIHPDPIEGKLGHVHFKNVKSTIKNEIVTVTMDWKLSQWKEFTKLKVTKNGAQVQASLKCQDKDMVTQIWKEKYFFAMKSMFGF